MLEKWGQLAPIGNSGRKEDFMEKIYGFFIFILKFYLIEDYFIRIKSKKKPKKFELIVPIICIVGLIFVMCLEHTYTKEQVIFMIITILIFFVVAHLCLLIIKYTPNALIEGAMVFYFVLCCLLLILLRDCFIRLHFI